MNLLQALAAATGRYRGHGVNHEGEPFRGDLQVERLTGGRAVLLRYTATLDDGTLVHEESTLLAHTADGRLCLWPVMSELDGVLPHVETGPAGVGSGAGDGGLRTTFASGPRDDERSFREEITLQQHPDGSLTYAHAWGLPGGRFEDRSSCRLVPADA